MLQAQQPNLLLVWLASLQGAFAGAIAQIITNIAGNRKLRMRIAFVVIGVALMASFFTVAQTPPPAPQGEAQALSFGYADIVKRVGAGIDSAFSGLRNNQGLKQYGATTAAFGLFIGMLWAGFKTMVGGKGLGDLIGEWVPLFVAYGVIHVILSDNGAGSIDSTMNKITEVVVSGTQQATGFGDKVNFSTASGVINGTMNALFGSLVEIMDTQQIQTLANSEGNAIVAALQVGLGWFFVQLMKLGAVLVTVIAACVYMAIAIMSVMSVSLAMALAPIMVPFLIFRPTAWLFDSWLKFLLGAGMMKVVGAFMLVLTTQIMSHMGSVAKAIAEDANKAQLNGLSPDIIVFGFMFLLSVLSALLMTQVPSIAAGLMGGGNGAGFGGLKGSTQNLGARSAIPAAKGAYKGARATAGVADSGARKFSAAAKATYARMNQKTAGNTPSIGSNVSMSFPKLDG